MKKIKVMKEELKVLANEIRTKKVEWKESQKKGLSSWKIQYWLIENRKLFRHKFIAYCLLRGKTYEQIESKCHENNQPDQELIQRFVNEYTEIEENVCSCEV